MKADVAALGGPARTVTVGRRTIRPSTKPRREYSLTNSSEMSLPVPYAPSGVGIVSGWMTSG